VLVGLLAVALPSTAVGQSGAFRLGVADVSVTRDLPAGTAALTGVMWSVDGAVGVGPVTLNVRYLQGPLDSTGQVTNLDLVEGEAVLWVAPLRWAALGLGSHARAYVQEGGTERWLLWEARMRGSAALAGPRLGAYLEGWTVFASDTDVPEPFDAGLGFEGGLQLTLGSLPLMARLRYRFERLTAGGDVRRDVEEQLGLAIGVGRR
jgi:hypothetical protein